MLEDMWIIKVTASKFYPSKRASLVLLPLALGSDGLASTPCLHNGDLILWDVTMHLVYCGVVL